MHSLQAISPLGSTEPRVDQIAGVTCTEVIDLALASVSARNGKETTCANKLKTLLKSPPPTAGKALLGQPFSAVWMGQDQWMIGADFAEHEDLTAELKTKFKITASITEQTDGWAGFDLAGEGVQAVLELLCNVNIRAMQSGDATRSSIHHLGCFVICGDPQGFFRILGPRASAGSLHHAITTAMKAAL